MGRNVFVTYKYGDRSVRPLDSNPYTNVRNYVNKFQELLKEEDHIFYGENDEESLEQFKDETIASKLRDKIFRTTVTIIFISKNMREIYTPESDQWIPWEISYSLSEHSRNGITSSSNALLAVVIPDENNNHGYFLGYNAACNSRILNTPILFEIIRNNMFNIKAPQTSECNGNTLFHGQSSYIPTVTWDKFISDIDKYINLAAEINANIGAYEIQKSVTAS